MKSNNIFYLIKEGFKGIFRHGFMSVAAVCVTVACLLIMGSFSVLLYNLNIMVDKEAGSAKVLVFIDESYTEAESRSVGSKINMIENVQQATFKTRQDALKEFVAGNEATYQGVSADTLRDRFEVLLTNADQMRDTVPMLEAIPGVAKVTAPFELFEGFATLQRVVRMVSYAVIALLLVVSLLIISNTIKLAMYDRKDEIAIMKMVGATNGLIRFPFMIEGLVLGMLGAAVAFGLEWAMYDGLIRWVEKIGGLNLLEFVPFESLLVPMAVIFGAAGVFVGFFGSFTSIRKFLDV